MYDYYCDNSDDSDSEEGVSQALWLAFTNQVKGMVDDKYVFDNFSLTEIHEYYGFSVGPVPVTIMEYMAFAKYREAFLKYRGYEPLEERYIKDNAGYIGYREHAGQKEIDEHVVMASELKNYLDNGHVISGISTDDDFVDVNFASCRESCDTVPLPVEDLNPEEMYSPLSYIVCDKEYVLAADVRRSDVFLHDYCKTLGVASYSYIVAREKGYTYAHTYEKGGGFSSLVIQDFCQLYQNYLLERQTYLLKFLNVSYVDFYLGAWRRSLGYVGDFDKNISPVQLLYLTTRMWEGEPNYGGILIIQALVYYLLKYGRVLWSDFRLYGPPWLWNNMLSRLGMKVCEGGVVDGPSILVRIQLPIAKYQHTRPGKLDDVLLSYWSREQGAVDKYSMMGRTVPMEMCVVEAMFHSSLFREMECFKVPIGFLPFADDYKREVEDACWSSFSILPPELVCKILEFVSYDRALLLHHTQFKGGWRYTDPYGKHPLVEIIYENEIMGDYTFSHKIRPVPIEHKKSQNSRILLKPELCGMVCKEKLGDLFRKQGISIYAKCFCSLCTTKRAEREKFLEGKKHEFVTREQLLARNNT